MKRCVITLDEWYPVYEVDEREPYDWEARKGRSQVDIPDETWTRIKAAFAEFDAVQKILRGFDKASFAASS